MNMNAAVATANLVGITGIDRRLVLDGALDEAAARDALDKATAARKPIAPYLREHQLVTAAQMAAANSAEFGMPVFDPAAMDPSMSGLSLVKEELLQKHAVLPLFKRGGKLFVGTADPTNTHALDEIKFHTNLVVEPILVDEDAIRINLERWLQAADAFGDALDDAEGLENLDIDSGEEEQRDAGADGEQADTTNAQFVKTGRAAGRERGGQQVSVTGGAG